MSASTEVQRTLVKSPPELWAELSDPTALARHLAELGEVRIIATEPERAVAWEATAGDGTKASGRVEISPSGWGTRVTFIATRTPSAPPAPSTAPAPLTEPPCEAPAELGAPAPAELGAPAPAPRAEGDPFEDDDLPEEDDPMDDPFEDDELEDDDLDDPYTDDDPYRDDDPDGGDEVLVQADHAIAHAPAEPAQGAAVDGRDPEAEPRRGLLARLLGLARRAGRPPADPAVPAPPACGPGEEIAVQLPPPALPSSVAIAQQVTQSYESAGVQPPADAETVEPRSSELAALDAATLRRAHAAEAPTGGDEPASDIAGELREAEEVAAEHVRAVLRSALDRLGSAHHRPFSRA